MSSDITVEPVNFGDTLHPFEHQWVALDCDHNVIDSDQSLTALVDKLTPAQQNQNPIYMQVLPHDLSFISVV